MTFTSSDRTSIIRTERGLTISGTRITLYDVIELLKAKYPTKLIQDRLNLSQEQINTALLYIQAHSTQLETEYQEVLRTREEIYRYWQEKNKEKFAKIASMPKKLAKNKLWERLEAQKAQRLSEK